MRCRLPRNQPIQFPVDPTGKGRKSLEQRIYEFVMQHPPDLFFLICEANDEFNILSYRKYLVKRLPDDFYLLTLKVPSIYCDRITDGLIVYRASEESLRYNEEEGISCEHVQYLRLHK